MTASALPDSAIRLKGLRKTYSSGLVALDGIDLNVRRGEFVAVLGASGCGKSTLLRLIAGLAEPSAGRCAVYLRGERASGIGFVFQEPTLMPWTDVAGNVGLPLALTRTRDAERPQRIREALDLVGLSAFAQALPRELSGGMKMRASIARALVTRPEVLLMDEPFAALDELTRLKLNDDLLELWQRLGKTIVFVTHSVFEAVYLAQRVIVLSRRPARVVQEFAWSAPVPRPMTYRASAEFSERSAQALQALRRASGEDAP